MYNADAITWQCGCHNWAMKEMYLINFVDLALLLPIFLN